jgi:hypothetical protein
MIWFTDVTATRFIKQKITPDSKKSTEKESKNKEKASGAKIRKRGRPRENTESL